MTLNSPAVAAAMLAIMILTQLAPTPPANLNPFPAQLSRRVTANSPSSSPGSPCLTPSTADISTAQLQTGGQNVSIPGHVVPSVRSGKALRTRDLSDSLNLHLELVFSLRNAVAFKQCLESLTDPTSPNFEHFLNATTLEPYVPTPGQKQSMTNFLQRAGFTVSDGASPIVLELTGSVRTVSRTFTARMELYQQGNNSFYSPDSDPTLPQSFAALTNAVMGLDNYSTPRPAEFPCSGPYCPQGIQVGYSLTSLYSGGDNGAGQTVAVVDAPGDPHIQSAMNTYTTQYSSLPSITLTVLTPDGTPSSYNAGWASETAMDVEAVHTVAPEASITLLYGSSTTGTDLMNLIDYVATSHLAKIVSNSWTYACNSGPCSDIQLPSLEVSSVDTRLAIDVARGLTILFASGDAGAEPGGNLGTEFPASDPNVLAVGATNLVLSGCTSITCAGYSSESGASISGGGYSGYFTEPSWQTSTIGSTASQCPSGHLNPTCRAVPDVSMLGGTNPGPGIWVYSSAVKACTGGSLDSGGWFGCSGTSLSTALWAGFLAIVLQLRGGAEFGNIDPLLYQIASSSAYSSSFHDVTSGNNGFPAVVGWDPVTGWGSPIASGLAADFSAITFYTIPTDFPGASSPGSITACGGTFMNGQSSSCPSSFTATANLPSPSTAWQFDHWASSGGLACTFTGASASCSVLGSGSLTAVYATQITFGSALISWGSCANPPEPNGATIFSPAGTAPVCYVPTGYSISSWTCSGGLSCSGSSNVILVSITGPGTITLNLKAGSLSNPVSTSLTASATPSNPTHGSSFTVSGALTTSSGGLGGETIVLVFGWSTNIVTVKTASDGSYTYNTAIAPTSPGSYNVDAFFLGDYTGSPQYLPSKATANINTS